MEEKFGQFVGNLWCASSVVGWFVEEKKDGRGRGQLTRQQRQQEGDSFPALYSRVPTRLTTHDP